MLSEVESRAFESQLNIVKDDKLILFSHVKEDSSADIWFIQDNGNRELTVFVPYDTSCVDIRLAHFKLKRGIVWRKLNLIGGGPNLKSISNLVHDIKARVVDLSDLDVCNVEEANGVYAEGELDSIDLTWTQRCNNLKVASMLFNHTKVEEINISELNSTNLEDATLMFSHARTKIVGTFNTSKLTNTNGMFSYFSAESLDLRWMDMSNVRTISRMFENCKAKSIDISEWKLPKCEMALSTFKNYIGTIEGINDIDFDRLVNADGMFENATIHNTMLELKCKFGNMLVCSHMFKGCTIKFLDLRGATYIREDANIDKMLGLFDVKQLILRKCQTRLIKQAEKWEDVREYLVLTN